MNTRLTIAIAWLTGGWQHYWRSRKVLILASIIYFAPSILSYGRLVVPRLDGLFVFSGSLIQVVLLGGMSLLSLHVVRGNQPKTATIFAGIEKPVAVVVTYLLYVSIVVGGILLFVVPGLIWGQKYVFSFYLVMDKNVSPLEALRASAQATKGHKGKLLGVSMAFLLPMAAALPFYISLQRAIDGEPFLGWGYFIVGLSAAIATVIVVVPWSSTTLALAFEELTTQQSEPEEQQKHSGIGIASFIVSLAPLILTFALLAILGAIETSSPGAMDEESTMFVAISLFFLGLLVSGFVSLGLGIRGLAQKDRKKTFAILGTVFSSVTILGLIMLIITALVPF